MANGLPGRWPGGTRGPKRACAPAGSGAVRTGNGAGEGAAGADGVSSLTISPAYGDKPRRPAGPWLPKHVGHAYVTKVARGRGLWAFTHVAGADFGRCGPRRASTASPRSRIAPVRPGRAGRRKWKPLRAPGTRLIPASRRATATGTGTRASGTAASARRSALAPPATAARAGRSGSSPPAGSRGRPRPARRAAGGGT